METNSKVQYILDTVHVSELRIGKFMGHISVFQKIENYLIAMRSR